MRRRLFSPACVLVLLTAFSSGCGSKSGSPAPPAADVTGTWMIMYEESGFWYGPLYANVVMQPDGSITGTYDGMPASGSVSGHKFSMTVIDSGRTIYVHAVIDTGGTAATGTWHDTDGYSGDWNASML